MQLIRTLVSVLCVLVIPLLNKGIAQEKAMLEKTVSLNAVNKPIVEIFKSISNQTGAVFSYGQSFNANQTVSVNCFKKPLRLVLNELINTNTCYYKVKSQYIIIKCGTKKPSVITRINGTVYSAEDSSSIEGASIYIKQNKASAITKTNGSFTITHSTSLPALTVSFAKENYKDTSVVIVSNNKNEVTVFLYPKSTKAIELPFETKPDTLAITATQPTGAQIAIQAAESPFWKKLKKFNRNLNNISDTLFTNVSFSVVPKISTNSLLAFNTVNRYALNLLVGYSKGIEIIEIGGLLNIDNGYVKYVQLAGLGNIVAGEVKGFQAAGLFNFNNQSLTGVQCAGLINNVKGNVKGFQSAGLFNFCHQMNGAQFAGLGNHVKGNFKGIQGAGLFNFSHHIKGTQCAGLFNSAAEVNGAQIAGLMNKSKSVNGIQLAGLFNSTKNLKGVQLGLINFADSASGIPIGLFSIVKKGYHKIEVAADENNFVSIGYGSGVEHFYNLIFGGAKIDNTNLVTLGYGLGSSFKITKHIRFALLASSQQMQDLKSDHITLQLLNKLFAGPEFRITKHIALAAGPTYNTMIADVSDPLYETSYLGLVPKSFTTQTFREYKLSQWIGFKVALKLL